MSKVTKKKPAPLAKPPAPGAKRVTMLDVEKAKTRLEHCTDLATIKQMRDQAEAVSHYHRAQKAGDESAAYASVIAREAERRAGEVLKGMDLERQGAGRPQKELAPNERPISPLASLGLTKRDSERFHAAAAVPEEDWECLKAEAIESKKPIAASAPAKIARQRKKEEHAEGLRSKPLPPPTGTFDVIVADPPWQYEKRAADVTHRGRNPYPDMDLGAIKALPVAKLAEPNCILWLWTTNAFMREAFEVLDAWGFANKTILTWAKDRMGTGDWLRGKTEHCLLAVRGKPIVQLTNQTTLLTAPLREHSRKPDEFYSLVEALCPGTKVELFAREARPGWRAWGAETGKFQEAS